MSRPSNLVTLSVSRQARPQPLHHTVSALGVHGGDGSCRRGRGQRQGELAAGLGAWLCGFPSG